MQLRRETLGSQVYDLLRGRILRGELPGGARLAQGPLSEEIGTSRVPIRDALKRLESEGLIVSNESGRYTVVRFGMEDVDEVYAIRRRLEPFAVELAVPAMTPQAMERIEVLFGELAKAARRRQLGRYSEINVDFHMAIYAASGMTRLARVIRSLYVGVFPLTPMMLEGRIVRSQEEHAAIMERLLARDAAGAARAMDRHIENACAELRQSMTASGEPTPPAGTARRPAACLRSADGGGRRATRKDSGRARR